MTVDTDLNRLKRAVARVTSDADTAGRWLGTSFYVGDGFVLSAWHVVAVTLQSAAGSSPPTWPLRLEFVEAAHVTQAKVVAHDAAQDWVILECRHPPAVAPILCGTPPVAGAKWTTYGFPVIAGNGLVFWGEIIDPDASDAVDPQGKLRALQLFADPAAAGQGAPMDGFSGGPCMVGDHAVGVMRSALKGTALDGGGSARTITVAGTGFACPARTIVERVAPLDRLPLPGGWSLPHEESNFLVVRSAKAGPSDLRVLRVAQEAWAKLPRLPTYALDPPMPLDAGKAIESTDALLAAVRQLCRARVVVFDGTDFEPEVMLLLGIRAAVRRGVTILSIGGDYRLGDSVKVPFNLIDANIVSHSPMQGANDERMRPIPLLATRLQRALEMEDTPHHIDLPVYEAVRHLAPLHRRLRPADSGVLVLCSFDADYTALHWNGWLKDALQNERDNLIAKAQGGGAPSQDALGVARSLELVSPQLVSRAIYEETRRAQCCVADLTRWPATVFFELGVRLAVSPEPTACLIDEAEVGANPAPVRQALVELLVPPAQRYRRLDGTGAPRDWIDEPAFSRAYGPQSALPHDSATGGSVYRCVERYLAVDSEPAARPVHRELLDAAQSFARQPVGGSAGLAYLYLENAALRDKVESADFERRLAAWFYLVERWGEAEALADAQLRPALSEALNGIDREHKARLAQLDEAHRQQVERLMDKLLEP